MINKNAKKKRLMRHIIHQDVDMLREDLKDTQYFDADSECLERACVSGNLEMVNLLIPISDPKARGNACLASAAWNGYLEVVKTLLPLSDANLGFGDAFKDAVCEGKLEVAKYLLNYVDPNFDDGWALVASSSNDHERAEEALRLLIPITDPKYYASALEQAVIHCGDVEQDPRINILFDLPGVDLDKVRVNLARFERQGRDGVAYFIAKYEARKTKELLESEIDVRSKHTQMKKIM